MRRYHWVLLFGLLALSGAAAYFLRHNAHNEPRVVVVPLKEIPAEFIKKAKDKLPDLNFDHAQKLPHGNFEIRGRMKSGKIREVEINPSGEVVEVE
jgi:hypothetical protein